MVVAKKKDDRTRNWTFVVYPESAVENWREVIDELHVPWVESPLHDKDKNPDGEPKKAHWHVAMFFSTKKSYEQILAITESIKATIPQRVENAKGMVRYFCHMDNPEKFQYSKTDIVAHGGVDIAKYLTNTGGDRLKVLAEMQEWIDENDCTEFSELARYAVQERFDDWYEVIATQSTLFLNTYIRSKRHSPKEQPEKTEEEIRLEKISLEFKAIQKKDMPDSAKSVAYVDLMDRIEKEFGIYVVAPSEDDLRRPEVILYQAILNACPVD